MGDILSQEELDALLSQMQDDGDEAAAGAGGADVASEGAAQLSGQPASTQSSPADSAETALDAAQDVNVGMVLNLPMKAQVEIGRARLAVGEILRLCQGSVIELAHMASDLIDLTVNDKVVAQGEAVVVNESFGFRVLEVESIRDRIKKL